MRLSQKPKFVVLLSLPESLGKPIFIPHSPEVKLGVCVCVEIEYAFGVWQKYKSC